MSWQVKDEVTELNNVKEQIAKIRDSLFLNSNVSNLPASFITGGTSGKGSPIGAGNLSGLQSFNVDKTVPITDIDPDGVSTGFFNRIKLTTSNMVITTGLGSDIQWIDGTLNDGQFIILKSKFGTAFTLKTGGNVAISSDIIVGGSEFCILIFHEDVTSPDAQGNYTVHKALGGGGGITQAYQFVEDEGSGVTQRDTMNFVGAGVTTDDFGGKTRVTIPGAVGSQSPWLGLINADQNPLVNLGSLSFDLGITRGIIDGPGLGWTLFDTNNTHAIDVKIGTGVGGLPQAGFTNSALELNVPLDMNLAFIKFQAIGVPPPPAGLEKRFLFCDAADNDKLKARTPTGIIDLEGLITNMGNLNNSAITVDLNFVFGSGASSFTCQLI